MIDELAERIWGHEEFHRDYELLRDDILRSNLRLARNGNNLKSHECMGRLLQSATCFSACTNRSYREAAYRIATACWMLFGEEYDNLRNIADLILRRLGNFPTSDLLSASAERRGELGEPKYPAALWFEVNARQGFNTVIVAGEEKLVLTNFQRGLWEYLKGRNSVTVSAPTSAGKSYVLQHFLASECASRQKYNALYIVPTRALINQVSSSLDAILKKLGETKAITLTIPVPTSEVNADKVIYVLTQERLQLLMETDTNNRFDLLIVDESQIIADDSRGVVLQTVVEKVLGCWPDTQVMFASPSTENPEILPDVFGIEQVSTINERECPVAQNRILLDITDERPKEVDISVAPNESERRSIGTLKLPDSLYEQADMLAYLTWVFGKDEKNLTYASTPSRCEVVASKISQLVEAKGGREVHSDLRDFAHFVKEHIHPDYILAEVLDKGVAFHYGNMPTLIRRTIERLFEVGQIDYLVCTSTLLYGVNLPAKNMFMLKPSKGREWGSNIDVPITSVEFWNLSGRAGRLGKDFEGNIFLVNYNTWGVDPLEDQRQERIRPALAKHLEEHSDKVLEFIKDRKHIDRRGKDQQGLENTFVMLLNDYRDGVLEKRLSQFGPGLNKETKDQISEAVKEASESVKVPAKILKRNITISPFRQQRMLEYLTREIANGGPSGIVPLHPLAGKAYGSIGKMFRRIDLHFEGISNRSYEYFTMLAFQWMRGEPLRRLIDEAWRRKKQKAIKRVTIGPVIRELMDNIEQGLRFRYLRYSSCYIDLLKFALSEARQEEWVERIPPIPLYLELGACSDTMVNLIGIGLSRITAGIIAERAVNKEMGRSEVLEWLKRQNLRALNVPSVCIREVEELL